MSINLTLDAQLANAALNKQPNIVLEIEGVSTIYGAVVIDKKLRYGDAVLYGDPGLVYGGSIAVADQESLVSFQDGTTTEISQNVNIDTGIGNSIQSMQIALVDKNGLITELITPGQVITDLLGERCTISYGFDGTNYPDDFITLFKGRVDDIVSGAGIVKINIISADNAKRTSIMSKKDDTVNGAVDISQTTVVVDDASDFFIPVTGPSGGIDSSISYFIRIDDEVIKYTGISTNTFTGCVRAQLGTLAAAHDDGADVESFIRLEGNAMDLALKIMLSGKNGDYVTGLDVESYVNLGGAETLANSIFFKNIDLKSKYNITVGDYVTTSGSSNPSNDITLSAITGFTVNDNGDTTITVADTLVAEVDSPAVLAIRSQYDVFGADRGFSMDPQDVDIDEHLQIKNAQLANFDYDFYIKDDLDKGKDFLDQKIYNPASCYSLVRDARSSLGIQTPPLPGSNIRTIDASSVLNAKDLQLQRTSSKNFFNGIIYKMDDQPLEDRFIKREVVLSGPSIAAFGDKIPNKYLVIEASGMRDSLGSRADAASLGARRLAVYEFGAESLRGVRVNLQQGLTIEPGDVVLLDFAQLKLSDKESATRSGAPRLMRVDRKSFSINTGVVKLDLVDTKFDKDARFMLIAPSSKVKFGNSATEFIIKSSFGGVFGENEFLKWQDYVGVNVIVRSRDHSTVSSVVELLSVSGNTITTEALGFTPTTDMIMEFAPYDNLGTNDIVDTVKLLFWSFTDDANAFADGGAHYQIS